MKQQQANATETALQQVQLMEQELLRLQQQSEQDTERRELAEQQAKAAEQQAKAAETALQQVQAQQAPQQVPKSKAEKEAGKNERRTRLLAALADKSFGQCAWVDLPREIHTVFKKIPDFDYTCYVFTTDKDLGNIGDVSACKKDMAKIDAVAKCRSIVLNLPQPTTVTIRTKVELQTKKVEMIVTAW